MKTFWTWAIVVWSLLFSLCGVIWSLYNTRDINELKKQYTISEKGEYKWQTLLD